jgi:hypothetical protein
LIVERISTDVLSLASFSSGTAATLIGFLIRNSEALKFVYVVPKNILAECKQL